MFVVRSESGMTFTSTAWDETNGEELKYKTKIEAEKEKEFLQQTFPNEKIYVEESN